MGGGGWLILLECWNSKMFEAIFQILKQGKSLELMMTSYQLLLELNKV